MIKSDVMKEIYQEYLPEIKKILRAVISVNTHVPEEAMTADLLGTDRKGHGVVIRDDGLIVTIGYLIHEAEHIWIGVDEDTMVPGYAIGYDYDSGLGLVKATLPLNCPSIPIGKSADINTGDPVFIAGSKGIRETIESRVIAKQEFAGRWEYVLDEAIYTAPAHPNWAGAALLDQNGKLCGIGSLLIQDINSDNEDDLANVFVPIDLLTPVIDDLCQYGRRQTPPRPWLGLFVHDDNHQLLISGVYRGCPGDRAGLIPGDIIVSVNGIAPSGLANFFRQVWSLGSAGVGVPLTIMRDGKLHNVVVHSSERNAYLKKETIN